MLVNKVVMGESLKKHRSFWDAEENSSHHESGGKNTWVGKGQYPSYDGRSFKEQSSSKSDSSSKRNSGWNHSPQNSLLQSSQRINKDVVQLPETDDHKKDNFYRDNMSPSFDGRRQRRDSQFFEHGLDQSRRLPQRGRSRSPGRAKGRSRSRSRSRDRGWRNRSRSRSRDKGNLRDMSRSCTSPNCKGDPYGWDDRQIGSQISKVCRDFANGRCRRGDECRFFHPDKFKNKDGYSSEYILAERWSDRHENGDVSRYADGETNEVHCRGKNPDAYDIGHEQAMNNRGIIICKNFGRGTCRWGASCRFSHSGSSSNNYDSSVRNASSDYNWKHEPSRTSRPLCKYFVVGKCYTENCRFSHDGPIPNNVESIPSNDIGGHRLDDKNDNWVGPKWNDEDPSFVKAPIQSENLANINHLSDVHTDRVDHIGHHGFANPNELWNKSAWDDAARTPNLENTSERVDTAVRENSAITVPVDQTNSRWAHNLENEKAIRQNSTSSDDKNDNWVGPKWNVEDSSFVKDPIQSENLANINHLSDVHTDRADHIGDHGFANPNELWNKSAWDDTARNRNLEKTSERVDTAVRANSAITVPVDQTNSRWAHNLENESAIWQNSTSSEERNVYPNVTANTSESTLKCLNNNQESTTLSQDSPTQTLGGSSVHDERHNKMEDVSCIFLSTEVIHPCLSSNPHLELYPNWGTAAQGESKLHAIPSNGDNFVPNDSTQSYQKKDATTRSEVLELSMPRNLSGASFSMTSTQMHGSPAPLTKKIEYEPGKTQQHAIILPSVVSSDSNSELLPTFKAEYTQSDPVITAPDLCHVHDDGSQWGMPGNSVMHVNASNLSEHEIKSYLKQLIQSYPLNVEAGNIKQCNASNVECPKERCLNLQESGAKSEVNENNGLVAKDCEDEQRNNNRDNAGVPGKCEVVNGNKDDKESRLFKNALIELVKEILKPTWKEGRMSREVHKTIVKKVVDKVMGSIQGDQFPKTQDTIEQYLSYSNVKINKLAQAYVERSLKENS